MIQYFVSRESAVKRLMAFRQGNRERSATEVAIVGQRRNGTEVRGVDAVLADVKACRLLHYRCLDSGVGEIVFITWSAALFA
jgi:hypothetical protein